jgi:competence protein ComEA
MTRVSMLVALAAASVALTGLALIALDGRTGPLIIIEDPLVDTMLVVAVSGAVTEPGLYTLPAGSRVADALAAAGGTTTTAELTAVNPARRLHDEDHLIIPSRGSPVPVESALLSPTLPSAIAVAAEGGGQTPTLVDLNEAPAAELDALPGIGPALAARIVTHRQENGAFRSLEELARIEGISPRMVEELRPLVSVGG